MFLQDDRKGLLASQKPFIPRLARNPLKISIDFQGWRGFRFASPTVTVAFGTSSKILLK
jgi:hypothetical protein